MSDHFEFKRWKGIEANSGRWYKPVELIAAGKNAATFLAFGDTHPFVGIPYAIKVFRRISSEESLAAFLDEAGFLKELDHPGIMRVVDDGTYYQKNPFLVAEYLPHTLQDVIEQGASLHLKLSFTIQLLSSLKYLSTLDPPIIHRDLKPANIFVRGVSCIIGDFGLKKILWPDDQQDGDAVKMSEGPGMPLKYRTPELVRYYNKEPNVDLSRSDVFQLGLSLAELFMSVNPLHPAADYSEPIVIDKVGRIEVGEVGAGINGLITKMLAKNPNQRPSLDSLIKSWKKVLQEVVDSQLYLHSHAFVKEGDR